MTERFKPLILAIHDFKDDISYDLVQQGEVNDLCELINNVDNENKELKQEVGKLTILLGARNKTNDVLTKWSIELEEENKWLKSRIEWFEEVIEKKGFKVK